MKLTRSLFALPKLAGVALALSLTALNPLAGVAQSSPTPPLLPLLDSLFSDNMVLQRGTSDAVWGWTMPGTTVHVAIAGKSASRTADSIGKWTAKLPPLLTDGPYKLTVTAPGGASATCSNVMVGDVWVCSGQSNMQFGVGNLADAQQVIAAANDPNLRLLSIPQNQQLSPQPTVANTLWSVCTPSSIAAQGSWGGFSAVGYYFGRELRRDLHVPIGLVLSSVGGTPVEAWTSELTLGTKGLIPKPELALIDQERSMPPNEAALVLAQLRQQWYAQNDPSSAPGQTRWAAPNFDTSSWQTAPVPDLWGQTGVSSLNGFFGTVWFRRTFDVPADSAGKSAALYLTVDDNDATWVNGNQVGATDGYNVPRAYPIPAGLLRAGSNTIAVRVFNGGGDGGIYNSVHLTIDGGGPDIPLAGQWPFHLGASLSHTPPFPQNLQDSASTPSVLYNGMIAPLQPYGIKGAIWYQGEANEINPAQYHLMLPAMIGDWRANWGEGNFPFIIAQLANYMNSPDPDDPSWPVLREAQWETAQTTPNTGIATAMDIGEATNIHPKNKLEVGRRLALVVRRKVYHEDVADSGPLYHSMTVAGSAIRLTFTQEYGGLTSLYNGPLEGFEIAGSDRRFYPADARISGQTVIVSSPRVPHPVAARYAWAAYSYMTLYNAAGLPAFPFRTDHWEIDAPGDPS